MKHTIRIVLLAAFMLMITALVTAQPYNEWVLETTLPGQYDINGTRMPLATLVNDTLYVMGGNVYLNGMGGGQGDSVELWAYDLNTETWTQKADMIESTGGTGVTHYEGKIYHVGKFGGTGFFIYDIATDTWSQGANITDPFYDFGMIAYEGKIYAATGGDNNAGIASNKTLIYDIATDTWSYGAEAPIQREGMYGTALVDGKIYAIGGSDQDWNILQEMAIYDIATDTWTTEPLPYSEVQTAYGSLANIGPYIFIAGGFYDYVLWDFSNMTWMYDTNTNNWTRQADLPFFMSEPGITSGTDTMWLVGGLDNEVGYYDEGRTVKTVYSYTLPSGCMDEEATNYNETAMIDDDSCEYPAPAPAPTSSGGSTRYYTDGSVHGATPTSAPVTTDRAPMFSLLNQDGEVNTNFVILGIVVVVLVGGYFMMRSDKPTTRRRKR